MSWKFTDGDYDGWHFYFNMYLKEMWESFVALACTMKSCMKLDDRVDRNG
jgi:hypothetical protein